MPGKTAIKITKKDVIWGYIAQFFNIGAGILILPIILRLLPSELLGIWYIFLTIAGFTQMLDFGFSPIFSQNTAYLFSGATKLRECGIDNQSERLDTPNYPLLKQLIILMKKFYASVSMGVMVILLTLGSWYIYQQIDHSPAYREVMIAWCIYIISVVLNFYYSYYSALLTGRGFIKENNQLIIITRFSYIFLATVGLLLGYGLIAVASANLFSNLINRILAVCFFYKQGLRAILRNTVQSTDKLFPIVWFNAKKFGISNIGGFLAQRSNLLFISMFLSLESVASYGLTLNLINILAGISPLYLRSHLPEIFKDRIENNVPEIRRIFGESILVNYVVYLTGAILLLTLGPYCLELFHSKTQILPTNIIGIMLIIQFLETNHSMAASLLTTRNEVPFLKASLVSGLTIAIFTLLSLRYTNWGITGVIILSGAVQLSYNNWKWPLMVCRELHKNYFQLVGIGYTSLKGWFIRHLHLNFPSL